jgi:hypothetical protein
VIPLQSTKGGRSPLPVLVVGVVAGVAWPVVYIMGYVIAGLAGWTVGNPTLTHDGLEIPIGMCVIVITFVVGAFWRSTCHRPAGAHSGRSVAAGRPRCHAARFGHDSWPGL